MEILIVPEIADELRVSETSVYRLIKSGHLRAVNTGVRRYGVAREELDRFIRAGGVDGPIAVVDVDDEPHDRPTAAPTIPPTEHVTPRRARRLPPDDRPATEAPSDLPASVAGS